MGCEDAACDNVQKWRCRDTQTVENQKDVENGRHMGIGGDGGDEHLHILKHDVGSASTWGIACLDFLGHEGGV